MHRANLLNLHRGRSLLAASIVVPALVLGAALRVVLFVAFHNGAFDARALGLAVLVGLGIDLLMMLVVGVPLVLGLVILPPGLLARPALRTTLWMSIYPLLVFHAMTEYFFFEEFNARFNHIALDYVLFPSEVFVNIWESYDVPLLVALALASGAALTWLASRSLRGVQFHALPAKAQWRACCAVVGAAAAGLVGLCVTPLELCANRITNEIALNGTLQLVRSYLTADLDYDLYYATLPRAEAHRRAAAFLDCATPAESGDAARARNADWQKIFTPAVESTRDLDVVVVLEESLGSQFVGALGAADGGVTPCFDEWTKHGLLLENLVATGNRTVRGLEGVLCSFVPLPGDSVVRRSRSENIATLGRVFRERGYHTAFLYGGYSIFDGMRSFFGANGWQEIIDQPDFPDDDFRTIWGVADEYIFDALLARQRAAAERHEHLFATLLSVSNHKPYEVPQGRSARAEQFTGRRRAVLYSDWCIGRYLQGARDAGLLEHTVVLIVGDHGARVYGSEKIPAPSYRIPALFLTPDPIWRGRRIERLCSQIDLAPTLLSLSGVASRAPFFGVDVTTLPADGGRAFLHHNRDIGLLTDDVLVVLGLQKAVEFYTRNGRASDEFVPVAHGHETAAMLELERNAVAVFQTAYELYQERRFVLPEAHGTHPTQ